MKTSRRQLLGGFATFPLIALVSSPPLIAACGARPPEAPLAHLQGQDWVHGAYELYSTRYAQVQARAESSAQDSYRVLAQKGVVALDALQTREVPFYLRVADDNESFKMDRKVPERLTFTADMDEERRRQAQEAWKLARDHIHTDYEEIRRLDWALTRLLVQLQRIRNAIEEGRVEQYRLVEQLADLRKDPTNLPYALPAGVQPKDYEEILLLLVERLEDDRGRLLLMEADIIAVGLTTRSTDANSATLAASIRKVLLAVVEDGSIPARAPVFPRAPDDKAKFLDKARTLATTIEQSKEFAKWKVEEREKKLAAFGAFLGVLDTMTGLPSSQIYKTVLSLWKGDHDYLEYMKTIVAIMPRGGAVARTISDAVEYTERARQVAGVVAATAKSKGGLTSDALVAQLRAQVTANAQAKDVVLNTASRFALERADKQLSFYKENAEVAKVTDLLAQTDLMKQAIPQIPLR
ncbi:MAG: hypothetical protein KF819_02130 [Labilithrix sp.]|nr:hypothetical protein [Labilithrix sp.]